MRPTVLPAKAVSDIVEALLSARNPIIITEYSGRNHDNPIIPGLQAFDMDGRNLCSPLMRRGSLFFRFSFDKAKIEADLILLTDYDVPWVPFRNFPCEDARIYHVDVDPLDCMMSSSHLSANGRWRADSYTVFTQLNAYLQDNLGLIRPLEQPVYAQRGQTLAEEPGIHLASFLELAAPRDNGAITARNVGATISSSVPADTVFVIEAVTCAILLSDQLQTSIPAFGAAEQDWVGMVVLQWMSDCLLRHKNVLSLYVPLLTTVLSSFKGLLEQ